MNYYMLVEGLAEKAIYRQWVPFVRPGLTYCNDPSEMIDNNFAIVSGGGYPMYLDMILAAIEDVRQLGNSRLVVAVDSEDMTEAEKLQEIDQQISAHAPAELDYKIVVQHFCFEAWALGNRKAGPRNPKAADLKGFKSAFDVLTKDPQLLPAMDDDHNRAQTAHLYLRSMLRDRSPTMIYTKSNPSVVATEDYLRQLQGRLSDTGHIASFDRLITAFS